jgi:hypothetical protein
VKSEVQDHNMLITTGKVDHSKIDVDSGLVPDGNTVTLLVHEGDDGFVLDATQEALLLEAIAEADRGEVIDATVILEKLRSS